MEKISSGKSTVAWNAHLLACMSASFAKISWDDCQRQHADRGRVFTLVHGDYHPANMMWIPDASTPHAPAPSAAPSASLSGDGGSEGGSEGASVLGGGRLVVLDWEAVGLGSGPQECAQYLISHMVGAERRRCEDQLLRAYYAALVEPLGAGVAGAGSSSGGGGDAQVASPRLPGVNRDEYTYADCYRDYVEGGVGRWVWLLALLAEFCPDNVTQYFHDQLLDFMIDHAVDANNIVMPRV